MTVESTVSRSGPYAGAGTIGPFLVGFRFLDQTHLLVVRTDASGVQTTLTLGIDYTVSGAGDDFGSVALVAVLAVGTTLTIQRNVPLTQELDYTQSDAFPAESHEAGLDKLTMIDQQLQIGINSSLRVPETATTLPLLPSAANRANGIQAYDSLGNPIIVPGQSGSASTLAIDLANSTLAAKGAGQIGFGSAVVYGVNTVGAFLRSLLVAGGAALIGFLQAGTGAVLRSLQDKGQEQISNLDFMTLAQVTDVLAGSLTLDVTTPLQNALTALPAGRTLKVYGANKISVMLTMGTAGQTLELADGASIVFNTPNFAALQVNGAYSTVKGGRGGGFIGPAAWDGAPVGGGPTYGVIWVTANNCRVANTRLSNVKKVGIWFKEVLDAEAIGNLIEGNFPSGSWTGTQTEHFGIEYDPPANTDPAGNFKAIGNTLKTCVQGVFVGNYGAGQFSQGVVITGNVFNDCWNHGVYTNYTSGAIIAGNAFNRCQQMVAVSGPYNAVVGNTSYTSVATAGDQRDLIGISFRDPQGCICSGNVMKGVDDVNTPVLINFQNFDGTTPMSQNVCEGNVLESTAGVLTSAIRMISAATPVTGNIIRGNSIKAAGTAAAGMIFVQGSAGVQSEGNVVADNSIVLLGNAYGVQFYYLDGSTAHHNKVTYQYNAGGAQSPVTVHFFNTTKSTCEANESICTSSFGTNLAITGFLEDTGCSLNRLLNSRNSVDTTHATFGTMTVLASSKIDINDSGPGAIAVTANPGSIWRRTDGTASNTLYLKESAFGSTTWRAV